MAKPYPMELRDRAVKFVQAGESRHAVASRLGLGAATVIRWLDRFEKTGTAAASKFGGYRKPKIVGTHRDWLLERESSAVILPCRAWPPSWKGAASRLTTRQCGSLSTAKT